MTLDPETKNAGLLAANSTRRANFTDEELRKFEGHMSEIFTAFGLDLGPGPKRRPDDSSGP
jgi:hypothetical protein